MDKKDPLLDDIGLRLQLIRRELDLNQKEFAHVLEVSGASLSEIEAGNARPRIEVYYNLTKKYNVNMAFLLEGKGKMFLEEEEFNEPVADMDNELRQFLDTFLAYFEKSRVVRYAMMTHFTTFLEENDAIIEKNMKKNQPLSL
jgi:transcriptional regulator with XRE-family HTH domain